MMFPLRMILEVLTAQRALVDRLLFAVRFPAKRIESTVQIKKALQQDAYRLLANRTCFSGHHYMSLWGKRVFK